MTTIHEKKSSIEDSTKGWFKEAIHNLQTDEMLYGTNTIPTKKKQIYENLALGSEKELMNQITKSTQQYYFTNMLIDFFEKLYEEKKSSPTKLAFDHKDREIMVWVEIKEGDEELEDKIFLSEAYVNNFYKDSGFSISATVIEDSDGLAIPSHYIVPEDIN